VSLSRPFQSHLDIIQLRFHTVLFDLLISTGIDCIPLNIESINDLTHIIAFDETTIISYIEFPSLLVILHTDDSHLSSLLLVVVDEIVDLVIFDQ
jgi:hypothetical protein